MNVNFINPVLRSMQNVLSTMAHIKPVAGTPKKKELNDIVHGKNISGLMSMMGKKGNASIALTFSEGAILHIAKNMLPSEVTTIDAWLLIWLGSLPTWFLVAQKAILKKAAIPFSYRYPQSFLEVTI